ncbi:MAG: hypothetical protein LQ341_007101 [Variospora aurantia]|nr:MAG: hypothetical protein LQ341_007101 [Variospora aurantia]
MPITVALPIDQSGCISRGTKEINWELMLEKQKSGRIGLWGSFLQVLGAGGDVGFIHEVSDISIYQFDRLETQVFWPTEEYVKASVTAKPVQDFLKSKKFFHNVYMVTSIKVAFGARVARSAMQNRGNDLWHARVAPLLGNGGHFEEDLEHFEAAQSYGDYLWLCLRVAKHRMLNGVCSAALSTRFMSSDSFVKQSKETSSGRHGKTGTAGPTAKTTSTVPRSPSLQQEVEAGRERGSSVSAPRKTYISHWAQQKTWPEEYYQREKYSMHHLLARQKLSASLRRKRSDSSLVTSVRSVQSDLRPREEKCAPCKSTSYAVLLETLGNSCMDDCESGITEASKTLCQNLLANKVHDSERYPVSRRCFSYGLSESKRQE